MGRCLIYLGRPSKDWPLIGPGEHMPATLKLDVAGDRISGWIKTCTESHASCLGNAIYEDVPRQVLDVSRKSARS
jgi:hypothetical protein